MPYAPSTRVYTFGAFTLIAAEHVLVDPNGKTHQLTARPMAMLVYMLDRPGKLLTKQALMDAVWRGVTVEENSLNQTVSKLRRLLGDSLRAPRFIETVPGRGYRFAGPVRVRDEGAEEEEGGEAPPSIAVLPFEDLSEDQDQAHFADGVAEETLNRFAQIQGLRTIGRTSSFFYRGRAERTQVIGEELGARYLVTGAVRKVGPRVRVSAQLIEAATGAQAWAQSFDRELKDVFAIEDEIAGSVAAAVRRTVGEAVPHSGMTSDPEAYDLFLRARAAVRRAGADSMVRAIALYKDALARDPSFTLAWVGVAEACRGAIIFAPAFMNGLGTLREAAERAVALAPEFWGSHVALAWLHFAEYDWAAYGRDLDEAERLAPGRPSELHYNRGIFLAQVGRTSDALEHLRMATRADPLSLLYSSAVQCLAHILGREAESAAEYERSLDLPGSRDLCEVFALQRAWRAGDPAVIDAQYRRFLEHRTLQLPGLDLAYEARARPEDVSAALRDAVSDPDAQSSTAQMFLAVWLAHHGDPDAALAAVRRSLVEQGAGVAHWAWLPVLAEVRKKPAFWDIVSEIGLVDYWRASGNWGEFARPVGADGFECV